MNEHEIQFGTLHPDGTVSDERRVKTDNILACSFAIMVPEHYREDGSCKCNDPEEQARMIREWDYTESDFKAP